jgi:hypothetical protein
MPFEDPRMDWIALADLPKARLTLRSTLVLPPSSPLTANTAMLAALKQLSELPSSEG